MKKLIHTLLAVLMIALFIGLIVSALSFNKTKSKSFGGMKQTAVTLANNVH